MSISRVALLRSIVEHIGNNVPESLSVYRPGVSVTKATEQEFVVPRLTEFNPIGAAARQGGGDFTLEVLCVIRTLKKSDNPLTLDALVDKVLPVVDSQFKAPGARVTNGVDPDPTTLGIVTFGPAFEEREYGLEAFQIERTTFESVDVSTLTVSCQVTPCS